jgi:alkylation response protein AidB-like acyl-CoA dehydrogenase
MWDLTLSDEQAMIAEAVRDFLAAELPLERLRPKAPPRDPAAVRQGMAALGWFGVGLPEAAGGSGLGLVEEMLVQRECGRHLASPTVLATMLGAHVALHAGDTDLAAALVRGEVVAALALPMHAAPDLREVQAYAFDWSAGDLLLAWTDDGMGLFSPDAFLAPEPQEGLDDSVTAHAGSLQLGRSHRWVSMAQAPLPLRAKVLLAARLVGLAEQACDVTVEYAKVREQFGQPIGAFQAVKHRCADMAVHARLAWDLTSLAALAVEAGEDARLQAASAKLAAAQAAHQNARAAIQLHGGIGYHAECDVHWFMKRAHLYDQVGGAMAVQAREVVEAPSPLR